MVSRRIAVADRIRIVAVKDMTSRAQRDVENARKFMNFMMDPVNMAILTENQGYGDAIQGTAQYYSEELKSAPEVNPPSDLNVVFAPTCSPKAQSLIDKVWTKVLQ